MSTAPDSVRLTDAWAEREVVIETASGRSYGPYLVGPPTVRVALTILETCRGAGDAKHEQHNDYHAAFADAVKSWLPEKLSTLLLSSRMARADAVDIALQQMQVGTKGSPLYKGMEEKLKKKASRSSWGQILADYRSVYHCSIADVLAEPWGLFIEQCEHVDRTRAKYELSVLSAVASMFSKNGAEGIMKRAGQVEVEELDEEERAARQSKNLDLIRAEFNSAGDA